MGIAIGDCLGMPVESMPRSEIMKLNDGQGITDFVGPIQNKIGETRSLETCATTDDWQLTEAVAKSLIRCREFHLWDQALAQVEALEEGTAGWGSTTRNSIQEIKLYFDSRGREGRAPGELPHAIEGKGGGNGVAMKIAPIALAAVFNKPGVSVFGVPETLGSLTHSEAFAGAAAQILCYLINLYAGNFEIISSSSRADQATPKEIIKDLSDMVEVSYCVDKTISLKLRSIRANLTQILDEPIDFAINLLGNSCLAYESVPLAIAISLRHPYNFQAGVLEAVNAGGDTDTIASMVGAILGAKLGLAGIPEAWRSKTEFEKTIKLADQLWETFSEKIPKRGTSDRSTEVQPANFG